jgi:very-short-patch-repair endonuclease
MGLRPKTVVARRLHRDSTDAEKFPWRKLREAFPAYRFRRQRPIVKYIADFACSARKLVIELDGGQHTDRVAEDDQRAAGLAEHGYRVIRFWNNDVLRNIVGVLETIGRELEDSPPHPSPLRPKGRRGGSDGYD